MSKTHANATTTLEMRSFIKESDLPTAVLARLLKISEPTVRKWRKRSTLSDQSHIPKQLNTTLSPVQEYVVVELRKNLSLSLDELLTVSQEFINIKTSRAGLQRCLKRHGVSRLADMQGADETLEDNNPIEVALEDTKEDKVIMSKVSPDAMREVLNLADDYEEKEVVQVKVTELPKFEGDTAKSRLLVANDPASNWVYVDIYQGDEVEAANRYMSHVLTKAPFHIRRILAGNYQEFLSRFRLLNEAAVNTESLGSVNNNGV